MPRKRRFSEEPFGPTIQRLMAEQGMTYRCARGQDGTLRRLPQPPRPRQPAGAVGRRDRCELGEALAVEPEHFREDRIRVITERLETMPDLIDRLYKRLR